MNTHKGGGHRARPPALASATHSICLLPFPSERESDGISGGADVKCSTFLSSVRPSVHPPRFWPKSEWMGWRAGIERGRGTMDYF